jgi:hypothetical protein
VAEGQLREKSKMDKRTYAIWFLILFLFAIGIYLIYFINSESYQCLNNSAVYTMKKLEEANHQNVTCLCSTFNKFGSATVMLTKDGFSAINIEVPNTTIFFNTSLG